MTSMGRASGAIFGILFHTGGKVLAGRDDFNAGILAEWLETGMTGIHLRGCAEGSSTILARFGRAKNPGERAIGHCDPGTVSMALILQFMYEFAFQA